MDKLKNIVVPVNKVQINQPIEADIKTQLLKFCFSSGSQWDQILQKKVNIYNFKSYLSSIYLQVFF